MYFFLIIFVFLIVGVVVDWFDRKKVVENCDWIRVGLIVVFFFILFSGNIFFVFCILFVRSVVMKFFFLVENSLV